jgi:HAD superfamily hydrolase (TIGR01549 family)
MSYSMVKAVIWDYDGTLVDTRRKNLQVTRALLPAVSGRHVDTFPGLASLAAYEAADRQAANWRELYGRVLGLSDEQVDAAGRLWTRFQLQDRTPALFFSGIAETLARLVGLPQAIFSQNSRSAIEQAAIKAGLDPYFELIVGYEEVPFGKQKPAPDGLLFCLSELGIEQGVVFYAGDHDSDIMCARQTSAALAEDGVDMEVRAVGAAFGGRKKPVWATAPDYVVRSPLEVAELVERAAWGE